MSHLLLSTLIAGSFHPRLSPSFTLLFLVLVLVLSSTSRTAFEFSTASLPFAATSSSTADRDRRGRSAMAVLDSPSTHNTLAVHAQWRLRRRGKENDVVWYPKLSVLGQFRFFVSGLAAQVVAGLVRLSERD